MKVPKYSRHPKTGQSYVTVNKKRHYLGKYGTPESEERYRRFIQELVASPAKAVAIEKPPGSDIEIVELCGAYWQHAEQYYASSPGSLDRIKVALRILKRTHSTTPVGEFGSLALQAIQHDLASQGKARTYVNHLCNVIRRVFKWGVAQEIVPAEVYQKLIAVEPLKKGRSAAKEKARIKAVADSVVDETIPYLQPIVGDMVRLQRLCGARPGEIVIIRPMDLDRSGDVWEFRPRSHKNAWRDMDEERVVFLGPRAQEILLPYLLRPADAYCFSPSETKDAYNAIRREERQSPMTPSQRARKRKTKPARAPGDHYTSNTYRRQIERTIQRVNEDRLVEAEKAGLPTEDVKLIPHWSPLQLRHSAGTEARKAFGLDGAQIMLGHKHARISEVYAEKSAEVGRLIASRIG